MALATSCHSSSPTLRRHGGHISAQRCERPQAAAAGGTEAPGRPGVRALRVGQGTHCTAAGTAPARPRAPRQHGRGHRAVQPGSPPGEGLPRDQLREPPVVRRGPRLRARPGRLLLAGWLGHHDPMAFPPTEKVDGSSVSRDSIYLGPTQEVGPYRTSKNLPQGRCLRLPQRQMPAVAVSVVYSMTK